MLRLYPFALGLLASVASVGVGFAAEPKAEEGWVPLFNGKDLTGWKMVDPPGET